MKKTGPSECRKRQKPKRYLGLQEIWHSVEGSGGFILATGHKHGRSSDDNESALKQLQSMVREKGLKYYRVDGRWKDEETGEISAVPFLLVPCQETIKAREFFDFAVEIARAFDQERVVVSTPGECYLARVVDRDGNVTEEMDASQYDLVAEVYADILGGSGQGDRFVLEGFFVLRPQSWSEALVWFSKGGL